MIDYIFDFVELHKTASWLIGSALIVSIVLIDLAINPGADPNLGFRDGSADFWGLVVAIYCAVKGLHSINR